MTTPAPFNNDHDGMNTYTFDLVNAPSLAAMTTQMIAQTMPKAHVELLIAFIFEGQRIQIPILVEVVGFVKGSHRSDVIVEMHYDSSSDRRYPSYLYPGIEDDNALIWGNYTATFNLRTRKGTLQLRYA